MSLEPKDSAAQESDPPDSGVKAKVYGIRSVGEVLEEVDASRYLALMTDRFGIAAEVFEPYLFFKPKSDTLWLINRDLELPDRPDPYILGMPFFRLDMRFPRPSTNAALKFGRFATRNRVELKEEEVAYALYRRDVILSADRCVDLNDNGYVITTFRHQTLGLGYYSPEDPAAGGAGAGLLKTHCPKMWTSKLGVLPPAQRPLPWDAEPEA